MMGVAALYQARLSMPGSMTHSQCVRIAAGASQSHTRTLHCRDGISVWAACVSTCPVCQGNGSIVAVAFTIEPRKLQHTFSRHAHAFGIISDWNSDTAAQLERIIRDHVNGPNVEMIAGTYRGTMQVTHFFNRRPVYGLLSIPAMTSLLPGSSVPLKSKACITREMCNELSG